MDVTERRDRRRWPALAVLSLVLLMGLIGVTSVGVALPALQRDLSATPAQLQWIAQASPLVAGGLMLLGGSLSDRYGRRLCLILGLLLFAAASTAAAFANSAGGVIAACAALGVATAFIAPTTLAIIRQIFPARERKMAVGVWGAVGLLGIVVGPVLGGWLVQTFSWTAAFGANVPMALVCVVGALLSVPESRHPDPAPFDLVGTGLSVAGMGGVVFGVTGASRAGWIEPLVLVSLVGGGLVLVAFVLWERRVRHPMLDVSLFANPPFSAAVASVALANAALLGVTFLVPQYQQAVLGLGPLESGTRIVPLPAAAACAALAGSWLALRLGDRVVVCGGLLCMACGFVLFSSATQDTGYGLFALCYALIGLGVGASATVGADAILGSAPEEKAGTAAAMNEIGVQTGGALGTALLGTVAAVAYAGALRAAEGVPSASWAVASESIAAATREAAELGDSSGEALLEAARTAFVGGMSDASLFGAAMTAGAALLAYRFLPGRAKERKEPA